ncbi:MAG: hypothetical protein FIB02_01950 [Desulfuromonas sp.]|nr:hypothetical protein [Desulfuromonas sp.]
MSETRRYVIRRTFLAPLGLALLLMGALLVVSILHGQPAAKVLFLLVFALPVTVLFVESALRRVEIDATGITVFRLLRSRRLEFSRVTALEAVQVRSRMFITLAAGDDEFLIISNGYADFPELVRTLVAVLPPVAITDEARKLADAPPKGHADLVTVWFMVAALVYVLIAQFRS